MAIKISNLTNKGTRQVGFTSDNNIAPIKYTMTDGVVYSYQTDVHYVITREHYNGTDKNVLRFLNASNDDILVDVLYIDGDKQEPYVTALLLINSVINSYFACLVPRSTQLNRIIDDMVWGVVESVKHINYFIDDMTWLNESRLNKLDKLKSVDPETYFRVSSRSGNNYERFTDMVVFGHPDGYWDVWLIPSKFADGIKMIKPPHSDRPSYFISYLASIDGHTWKILECVVTPPNKAE